jgi:hypothetical protein
MSGEQHYQSTWTSQRTSGWQMHALLTQAWHEQPARPQNNCCVEGGRTICGNINCKKPLDDRLQLHHGVKQRRHHMIQNVYIKMMQHDITKISYSPTCVT